MFDKSIHWHFSWSLFQCKLERFPVNLKYVLTLSIPSVPVQDFICNSQLAVPQPTCDHLASKIFVMSLLSLGWKQRQLLDGSNRSRRALSSRVGSGNYFPQKCSWFTAERCCYNLHFAAASWKSEVFLQSPRRPVCHLSSLGLGSFCKFSFKWKNNKTIVSGRGSSWISMHLNILGSLYCVFVIQQCVFSYCIDDINGDLTSGEIVLEVSQP